MDSRDFLFLLIELSILTFGQYIPKLLFQDKTSAPLVFVSATPRLPVPRIPVLSANQMQESCEDLRLYLCLYPTLTHRS
jgi:hypothetical protein